MPRWLVWLVVLSGLAVHAQGPTLCTVSVSIVLAGKGQPLGGLQVELVQRATGDSPSRVALTTSSGSAQFENLWPGDYQVVITGEGIETTHGQVFRVDSTHVFVNQFIAVRALETDNTGAGNSVNVHELNVPAEASQELARGDEEMKRKHWKQAADHYSKAVTIYPQYSVGYYDLSVAYYQLKQPDEQRDALQKALNIDDHFAPALVSLAHMEFADHKLPKPGLC